MPRGETEELETLIVPRSRDLGDGFIVRRALPAAQRQMVGPFIFFDQMGPALFTEGRGVDVRPHPHIGLATVTYLFEGAILHRDSVGSVQRIEPGAVNWMTAGRGIVHSERSPSDERVGGRRLFGIQIWVALPKADEEMEPSFTHFPKSSLPSGEDAGVRMRVIAGSFEGLSAPVPTRSPLFYVDVTMDAGAVLRLPASQAERAVYLLEGEVELGASRFGAGDLPVFRRGPEFLLRACTDTRLMLLGGDSMDGHRHIVWNFVSSSADRIARAKEDWKARRFPSVAEETEFIPLPDELPAPVDYP